MLDIKKVRYIRSALGGAPLLSSNQPFDWVKAIQEYSFNSLIPINLYMTSDGIARPKPLMPPLSEKPIGSIAKSTDIATLNNDLQKISTNLNLPKLNFFLNTNNLDYLGLGLSLVSSMFSSGEENSGLTNGINQGWNATMDTLGKANPLFKIIGEGVNISDSLIKSIGGGTDQMTTTDKILDSAPGTVLTMGLNGFLGKRTLDFSANKLTIELVGGSYGGSVKNINNAASKAGKKYGVFSSGSRKEADQLIGIARGLLNTMTGIANEASDMFSIASNMSLLNHMNYGFNLAGGYDLRYMRAAKIGGKLDRIKKLNLSKFKTGGIISGTVNLETKEIEWVPVIIESVEIYEEGGKISDNTSKEEWQPTIILDDEPISFEQFEKGGTVDGITGAAPKITFESWYKTIPPDRNDTTLYNLRRAFELAPMEELEAWRTSSIKDLKDGKNHLNSVYFNPQTGEYEFMKSKNHPTLKYELEWYNSNKPEAILFRNSYDLDKSGEYYKYVPKLSTKLKDGGKTKELDTIKLEETNLKNVIPEGALHARKHHMENADGLTEKGIPVIDNDREQLAEIELNEIIFTLEVTKKLEELLKDGSDEAAIEAGKLLVELILFNTDDRTGLISTLKLGGQLNKQ